MLKRIIMLFGGPLVMVGLIAVAAFVLLATTAPSRADGTPIAQITATTMNYEAAVKLEVALYGPENVAGSAITTSTDKKIGGSISTRSDFVTDPRRSLLPFASSGSASKAAPTMALSRGAPTTNLPAVTVIDNLKPMPRLRI